MSSDYWPAGLSVSKTSNTERIHVNTTTQAGGWGGGIVKRQ